MSYHHAQEEEDSALIGLLEVVSMENGPGWLSGETAWYSGMLGERAGEEPGW